MFIWWQVVSRIFTLKLFKSDNFSSCHNGKCRGCFLRQCIVRTVYSPSRLHVIWRSICDFLLVINSNLGPYLAPFSHNTSMTDGWVDRLKPIARPLLKYGRLKNVYFSYGKNRARAVHGREIKSRKRVWRKLMGKRPQSRSRQIADRTGTTWHMMWRSIML